jgi:two-component sensor histidine kinase
MANPHPGVADSFGDPKNDAVLTLAIINTLRDPLLVLDAELRVAIASRSFYTAFEVKEADTLKQKIYNLGNGQWDIPSLRVLLEEIIPQKTSILDYEVEHKFPHLGLRIMLLNAQEVRFENGDPKKILLTISDVTDKRNLAEENKKLLAHKDILLQEMRHRIANSLQLIASILLLKAQNVQSEETRIHLTDAHQRILSIATVQSQLEPTGIGNEINVEVYLTTLCKSLAASMIGDRKPLSIEVIAHPQVVESNDAILIGLITTELVINSIKHAFPDGTEGKITVTYEIDGGAWRLGISDNGVGMPEMPSAEGLGTSLVDAMARQLKAVVEKETGESGTTIWVIHRLETPLIIEAAHTEAGI